MPPGPVHTPPPPGRRLPDDIFQTIIRDRNCIHRKIILLVDGLVSTSLFQLKSLLQFLCHQLPESLEAEKSCKRPQKTGYNWLLRNLPEKNAGEDLQSGKEILPIGKKCWCQFESRQGLPTQQLAGEKAMPQNKADT